MAKLFLHSDDYRFCRLALGSLKFLSFLMVFHGDHRFAYQHDEPIDINLDIDPKKHTRSVI